jgi:oligopeptide transport system ATP-binding protein
VTIKVAENLLEIKDLYVSFNTYAGEVKALRGIDISLEKGKVLAIVGESGCGKSVTSQTIMKLLPVPPAVIKKGSILFEGKDLVPLKEKDMMKIRGEQISMIFQDPMTSLNPTMTIGKQITEVLIAHQNISKHEAMRKAIDLIKLVGIPNPESRAKQYPHEFSGGMRQRAMIAIALACEPKLLIADEPTTALDVTIQAQIIDLMKDLQQKLGTSIIIITHDLGVVADIAQDVVVMYAGKIVEKGTAQDVFYNPKHPYTLGLLKSVPRLDLVKSEELIPIEGTPPDLFAPPTGCAFADRCEYAMKICKRVQPQNAEVSNGHEAACWLLHENAPKVGVSNGGGTENV